MDTRERTNPTVDSEHEVQLGLFDALIGALGQGQGGGTASNLVDRLIAFSQAHFEAESALMRHARFPERHAHDKAHEHFRAELIKLRRLVLAGDDTQAAARATAVRDGLVKHMESDDEALARHLKDRRSA